MIVAFAPLTQHSLVESREDGRGALLAHRYRADGVAGERQYGRGLGALAAYVPEHDTPRG